MVNFENTEALLAWIVDFFSTRFGNSAILKGGMSLRLMHSPRYTNDVDYVFIPYNSKKNIRPLIENALATVKNLNFKTTINSKALRIFIEYRGKSAQIEISAKKECPSIAMSSALLSTNYGFPTRIVRIMEPSFSYAHKIAAWNERELVRDLYDIYQYESVFRIIPNVEILQDRLKNAKDFKGVNVAKNIDDLKEKLNICAQKLDGQSINELRPLLSKAELSGLDFRMRLALFSLCEKLR